MVKLRNYWWILALLIMSIAVSGCTVQFNFGVPGTPFLNTYQSTAQPSVTSLPATSPTPSIPSGPIVSPRPSAYADLSAASASQAAPSATPAPADVINSTDMSPLLTIQRTNNSTTNVTNNTTASATPTPIPTNSSLNATITPTPKPAHAVKLIRPTGIVMAGAPEFWQVKNIGTSTDTFSINSTPAGLANVMPGQITLAAGDTKYFTIFPNGKTGNATITATSVADSTVKDSLDLTV